MGSRMQEYAALYLLSVLSAQCSVLSAQCSVLSAQNGTEIIGDQSACAQRGNRPVLRFRCPLPRSSQKTSLRTLSLIASARCKLQSAPRNRQMRGRIFFCDPITDLWCAWSGLAGGINLLLPPGPVASCGQTSTSCRRIRGLQQAVGLGRRVSRRPLRP